MSKTLTVTKRKDGLHVKLGAEIPRLKKLKDGTEIPPEYLHSILSYHIANQDAEGNLDDRQVKRLKPMW